ncbi:U6 snRNA phosphodiesterase 1 isoform X2 [Brienomyrus brachyistius]|uniref:U6 snRNA phosphodiesterase 1 isoform X2 n=1 Tax=Brienomyrus brachyistius TaxID=42636 RepID=UPI0020B346FF|nr:U6 snRNA phosphodiesterase 1 isoform X2 [Brienomyrus brachyistius]
MLVGYSSSSDEEEEEEGNIKGEKRQRSKTDYTSSFCKKIKSTTGSEDHNHVQSKDGICVEETPPLQPKSRLPLPESVLEMFPEEKVTEDSSLHGGRVRSFQHERGNWATYVYLPYHPEDGFLELLEEMSRLSTTHGFQLTRSTEFHLSLSQTVVLRHHWIQPFVMSLQTGLAQCSRFSCIASQLKVYSNQEKTRTFLALEVSTGHAQLLELVRVVDKTMEEFNLSTFYQKPSFHISLAWCVGDQSDRLRAECLPQLQSLLDSHEDAVFPLRLTCQQLRCKAGNKMFCFQLC